MDQLSKPQYEKKKVRHLDIGFTSGVVEQLILTDDDVVVENPQQGNLRVRFGDNPVGELPRSIFTVATRQVSWTREYEGEIDVPVKDQGSSPVLPSGNN